MIISRTPFRISFFGGGSDYPGYYKESGGAVLSVSIDKFCYISCRLLPPFFDHKYLIVYTKRETVDKISDIQHPSVRETIRFMKENRGLSIHHEGDLPARTGIGSSSAFTVGLLNALHALKGKIVSKKQLALEAIHIEQNMIKENVGSQDQVIAAFGGLNKIEFRKDSNIEVTPITISTDKLNFLQKHLMLFFTGFSRISSEVAAEHIKAIPRKKRDLKLMHSMVDEAVGILNTHKNFDDFGKLLHENWNLKRSLTGKVSNPYIDDIYQTARSAGAIGGKLLGAGGGGFMIFFAKPQQQNKIREKLKNLLCAPFKFEYSGSQIIYYRPEINF